MNQAAYQSVNLQCSGVGRETSDLVRYSPATCLAARERRASAEFRPAWAQLVRFLGGVPQAIAMLLSALVMWIVLPTAIGTISLSRQDL